MLSPLVVESLGILAATVTTVCWLPQAVRVVRTRETKAISLWTYAAFAVGIVLWLTYGLLIGNLPLIGANAVSLVLTLVILTMKLRYG